MLLASDDATMARVERVVRPRVSYSDLCQQPDDGRRCELYDGEVAVVPSPVPLHQIVAMNIAEWLRQHPRSAAGLTLMAPLDIVFSDYNVVQPDIVYFEPERLHLLSNRSVIRVPPDIAIEVLSPSTDAGDRGPRMATFARYGVKESWLANPDVKSLEVYQLRPDGFRLVQRVSEHGRIVSPLLGALGGPVSVLFRSPLA